MKIWKRLKENHIFLDAEMPDRDAIFRFVADICVQDNIVKNADTLYNAMMDRENLMSTGVGGGIGLPHAVSWDAEDEAVILIRLAEPVDFKALDDLPVNIILAMVIPGQRINLHLRLLAGVSRLCKNSEFLSAVKKAGDSGELWQEIKEIEEEMAFH